MVNNTRLRDQFKSYLIVSGITSFRTRDALRWYMTIRSSPQKASYSNLYTLILKPLEMEGTIRKSYVHGHWNVVEPKAMDIKANDDQEGLDEFDLYLREKLGQLPDQS